MSTGRLKTVLMSVFGDRDEVPASQIRAALFLEYSEAELLRRGINNHGRRTRAAKCYVDGEPITEDQRATLIGHGMDYIFRTSVATKKWIEVDKQRGVVRRVRSQLDRKGHRS